MVQMSGCGCKWLEIAGHGWIWNYLITDLRIWGEWILEIGGCGDFQLGPAQQWWARLFFSIKIKTFEKSVLISRLVFIFFGYQSCYWNRYQHFADCSLDIETGIKTLRIAVFMLRLVSRLSELQYWYWDWYQDYQDCSPNIKTGILTFLF